MRCSQKRLCLVAKGSSYTKFNIKHVQVPLVGTRRFSEQVASTSSAQERCLSPHAATFVKNMVERIIGDLNLNGINYMLPPNSDDAMREIMAPLLDLYNAGVKPEFLIDACTKSPELFRAFAQKGSVSLNVIKTIVDNCGICYEDSIRLFACYSAEMLSLGERDVQARLDVLINCGVPQGRSLANVVRSYPAVLFASDPKVMSGVAEKISGFFSRSEISSIVCKNPHVLLSNFEELESKYEYIYYHMCIEGDQFCNCSNWIDMSLDEIMTRHDFLVKAGRYVTPDPKRPQLKMENPNLRKILDSSDSEFASDVAGVSVEEWNVYRELSKKLNIQKDMDRPFQKVKPSMRKAFERKKKEPNVKEPHVFDSGDSHIR